MTTRQSFLAHVRQALHRAQGREHQGQHAPAGEDPARIPNTLAAWQTEADQVRRRLQARREDLLLRLERMAGLMNWKVVRAGDHKGAAQAVAQIVQQVGARSVVRTAHPIFTRAPVEDALRGLGVECTLMAYDSDAPQESRRRLRQTAIQADIGITGVDYMVAETATAILLPRRGVSRLASLTPPRHIAIVEAEQVVETLADALTLHKAQFLAQGDPGGYWSLISGPSRTGDIEQTIVVGVHGPQEVYLVAVW
ncbi:MAG: lactate utilization protein [Dehalococcoidia bacterium]|nr:lactate utilization protein [Dehalococcoidia bacterium]MDW8120520.1 lactate utilization protein [Chloroflexota bacterium]